MPIGPSQLSDKELKILDCALMLLKETGDAGLTMRKLADSSGMRLSNVQYYFKSRDDVLKAMANRYFDACTDEITRLMHDSSAATVRERAHLLIITGLKHGDALSDMCRIFRELWAISTRNDAIRQHMEVYYRTFFSLISDYVLGGEAHPELRKRIGSLLLPFFEGYSVTAPSLPVPTEEMVDMVTDLVMFVVSTHDSQSV